VEGTKEVEERWSNNEELRPALRGAGGGG